MSYVLIPLTSEPDQKIQEITIPVDGQNLRLGLRIRYNTVGNYWWMTISSRNGEVLIDSLPLVVGQYPAADIFAPHKYMGLGSACVVNAGNAVLDYPNDSTLGVDFFLLWGDTI